MNVGKLCEKSEFSTRDSMKLTELHTEYLRCLPKFTEVHYTI